MPHAYDFEDPAERKPKKKYKLEGANFKANQPKEKEKPKDPKAHPDERIWRMARARKQAMFLLECEDMEEEGWKLLVRGVIRPINLELRDQLHCDCRREALLQLPRLRKPEKALQASLLYPKLRRRRKADHRSDPQFEPDTEYISPRNPEEA